MGKKFNWIKFYPTDLDFFLGLGLYFSEIFIHIKRTKSHLSIGQKYDFKSYFFAVKLRKKH
jgi:hypothetical protein